MVIHSNKGRFILIALLIFLPLYSFWGDFLSSLFFTPSSSSSSSSSSSLSISESNSDETSETAETTTVETSQPPYYQTYEENLPLFQAIQSNDLELVRSLLEGDQQPKDGKRYNPHAEDERGVTPFIESVLLGPSNAPDATPNTSDTSDTSDAQPAPDAPDTTTQMVKLLLAHGATPQPPPGYRHTPLRAACLTANPTLIHLLLEGGADPNAQSEGGRTPLMGACFLSRLPEGTLQSEGELSLAAVQAMMQDERTDPTIRNSFGESALDLCREKGYLESVALLEVKVREWEEREETHGVSGGGKEKEKRLRR